MNLKEEIVNLQNSNLKSIVENRLKEFEELGRRDNDEWFSEICFCILTANSRALSAIAIQNQIGSEGFLKSPRENIVKVIRMNKHRFPNNKAKFILEARQNSNIKDILKDKNETDAREWIVENIKGIGMKESSHFLRNIGKKNLAILDRHILNLMKENNYIKEIPKQITKNKYLEIEKKFVAIAREMNMSPAELDLYMWYLKTGIVLK